MVARREQRLVGLLRFCVRLALIVSLVLSPVRSFPNQPVGIVVATGKALVGSVGAAPGTTVFSGDLLATQKGGGLLVQAGKFQFFLNEDSAAAIFEQPGGIAVELESGSLVFSSATPDASVQLFASDVRIVPQAGQGLLGEIRFVNSCELRVTSQTGSFQVSKDKDAFTAVAGTSHSVVPGHSITSRTQRLAPTDPRVHSVHSHVKCAPLAAARASWFLPVMFVEVATATAVVLAYKQDVSPRR